MASIAHSPQQSVEVADSRLGVILYNPFLWLGERLGMAARRRQLLADAHGAVLEIGAGTGLNLRHYPAGLERLVLAEPGARMGRRIDLGRAPDDREPERESAYATRERLRNERKRLVGDVARRSNESHREIQAQVNRATRVRSVTSATIEQLERGNELLRRELWR
jgi:hypothetical protein